MYWKWVSWCLCQGRKWKGAQHELQQEQTHHQDTLNAKNTQGWLPTVVQRWQQQVALLRLPRGHDRLNDHMVQKLKLPTGHDRLNDHMDQKLRLPTGHNRLNDHMVQKLKLPTGHDRLNDHMDQKLRLVWLPTGHNRLNDHMDQKLRLVWLPTGHNRLSDHMDQKLRLVWLPTGHNRLSDRMDQKAEAGALSNLPMWLKKTKPSSIFFRGVPFTRQQDKMCDWLTFHWSTGNQILQLQATSGENDHTHHQNITNCQAAYTEKNKKCIKSKISTANCFDLVVSCHFMVAQGQGTEQWSPSLSRLNMWQLSSSWNLLPSWPSLQIMKTSV